MRCLKASVQTPRPCVVKGQYEEPSGRTRNNVNTSATHYPQIRTSSRVPRLSRPGSGIEISHFITPVNVRWSRI
jgi:hypothetical protein